MMAQATPTNNERNHSVDDETDTSHLNFGTPTPGTPATTGTKFFTPLSVFSDGANFFGPKTPEFGETDEDEAPFVETLGIGRAKYYSSDEGSEATTGSLRIGITRSNYELPEGDFPVTPKSVFLEKSNSPTPDLVEIGDDDAGSEFGGNWRTLLPDSSRGDAASEQSQSVLSINEGIPDGIPRLIHKQTADGHYLVSSKAADSPMDGLRYSITKGKQTMSPEMRQASEGKLMVQSARPQVNRSASVPGMRLTATAQPVDASFKIFILLLQPKSKIFELIQIIYSPSITTVGDILNMIPENSTEPALGAQDYTGLARPKNGAEITNLEMMASGSHDELECALITQGEILVGIPYGFTGKLVSNISKQIFANSRIRKLLRRSDPLSVKRQKSRRSRRSQTPRVATVDEEDEADVSHASTRTPEVTTRDVALAIKFANEQAEKDNAHTDSKKVDSDLQSLVPSVTSFESRPSLERVDNDESMSVTSTVSGNDTVESSINNSYHFRNSLKRMPRRSNRKRQQREAKKKLYIMRMAAAAFGLMICRYLSHLSEEEEMEPEDETNPMDRVLGLLGLFQALTFFLAMIDLQRRVNKRKRSSRGHVADPDGHFRRVNMSTAAT